MNAASSRNARASRSILVIILLSVTGCVALAGCDTSGYGSWGGMVNPWYTSSLGLPEYPTLYDPTWEIQSVIDYRQDVMDDVADGWSDYILE